MSGESSVITVLRAGQLDPLTVRQGVVMSMTIQLSAAMTPASSRVRFRAER
jgi:hypothetical protein